MRVDLEPAYILHRRAYRNTSAILEAFTRTYGRVGIVVRGLYRPKNALQAVLQPFNKVLLGWAGRSELLTLTQAESANAGNASLSRPVPGMFYMNELLIRLLQRDDPHERLFDLYESTMQAMACFVDNREEEVVLRVFEKNLLDELGYGLVLRHESVSGMDIEPEQEYRYIADTGPVLNTVTATGGLVVHGESLLALANENITTDRALRECKQLMRYILREHLGEKPLQSRMLYNRVY